MSARAVRRPRRAARGQAVLYAVVLSPVILLSLTFAVGLGALQLEKQRLRSALDEATTVAAARSSIGVDGTLNLDRSATATQVRQSIADNLRSIANHLDGTGPDQVAAEADVAVLVDVPAPDPFTAGAVVRRPTIEARIRAPVHSDLLSLTGLSPRVTFTVTSSADIRVSGGGAP